jgi:hypothetical protein
MRLVTLACAVFSVVGLTVPLASADTLIITNHGGSVLVPNSSIDEHLDAAFGCVTDYSCVLPQDAPATNPNSQKSHHGIVDCTEVDHPAC